MTGKREDNGKRLACANVHKKYLSCMYEGSRVLYGTKAFGIKNLNSNVSCKIMLKVVRIVQVGKGRRYGRRLLSNLKAGVPNAGY